MFFFLFLNDSYCTLFKVNGFTGHVSTISTKHVLAQLTHQSELVSAKDIKFYIKYGYLCMSLNFIMQVYLGLTVCGCASASLLSVLSLVSLAGKFDKHMIKISLLVVIQCLMC